MLLITGVYCVVGGMYSVVMNDLIQFVLKVIAAVGIAVIAIVLITPEQIMAAVPAGWDQLFFGPGKLTWTGRSSCPQLNDRIYGRQGGDGYSLFMFFTGMLFLKGVLVSMAGPTPNYAIQHILSTRSPREAALENMVMAVVSLAPRFLLIGAIAVLGIVFFSPDLAAMGAKVNFEKILPHVLRQVRADRLQGHPDRRAAGLVHEHLVSTVNSGAAYVVNDIYKRYINPTPPPKRYVVLGWITSSAVILLGIVFGFVMTKNVHSVTKWIVSALIPAFVAPNVLKWHWWRFNGYGFFAGMVAGTAAALIIPALPASARGLHAFLLILAISFAGLGRRLPADRAGERRGAEELLPHRAALGLLGTDLSRNAGPRIRSSRGTAISRATCSTSPSAWSGKPAWSPRPSTWSSSTGTKCGFRWWSCAVTSADPQVHLVRQAGPRRNVLVTGQIIMFFQII